MPDLAENFNMMRGDLLYGQARDRGHAQQYLMANHDDGQIIGAAIAAGAWITVDNYNYGLDAQQAYLLDEGRLDQAMKDKRYEQYQQLEVAVGHNDNFREYILKRSAFWSQLEGNRLGPLEVLNAPADKLSAEGWTDLWNNRYYLAIRRACKFGIEHVAAGAGRGRIHFVLNRFDQGRGWIDVLMKNPIDIRGRISMLITYSELRYVYKNWNSFQNRLTFYRYQTGLGGNIVSFPECPAPWEDSTTMVTIPGDDPNDPPTIYTLEQLWAAYYTPGKADFYRDKANRMVVTSARAVEARPWIQEGQTAFDGELWGEAVTAFKAAVRIMRG